MNLRPSHLAALLALVAGGVTLAVAATVAPATASAGAGATGPGAVLAAYTVKAGQGGSARRGAVLHRQLLQARPAADALAGATADLPLTHPRASDEWFNQHCPAALQRACTAREKADVVAWALKARR